MDKTPTKQHDFNAAWPEERSEYFDGVYSDLLRLKTNGAFDGKDIAVMGAWRNAGEIKAILEKADLRLKHIADNNTNKQGVLILGITSQSAESLVQEKNIVILVLNNRYWKELSTQLLGLGFRENRDFYVIFGGERFKRQALMAGNELRLSADIWLRYKEYSRLGYEAYTAVYNKYNRLPIWLMHQPSLGDLFIFAIFLPCAMGVRSIPECECVLVVTKNSVRKLAVALGFRHIELIPYEEANRNWLMVMRMMGESLNVHNAVFHGLNNIAVNLMFSSDITFCDCVTKFTLQMKKKAAPIYPRFPARKEHILKQFEAHGLIPGRTVVISPYAGHFTAQISDEHWASLVTGLAERGYTLCTNCGNDDEKPLRGTAAPFIELRDCVEFVETAGNFIGVRSGFCDLICMADCKKIVLYESGATVASMDFWGFERMGLGKDIIELENDCIHTNEMFDSILSYF